MAAVGSHLGHCFTHASLRPFVGAGHRESTSSSGRSRLTLLAHHLETEAAHFLHASGWSLFRGHPSITAPFGVLSLHGHLDEPRVQRSWSIPCCVNVNQGGQFSRASESGLRAAQKPVSKAVKCQSQLRVHRQRDLILFMCGRRNSKIIRGAKYYSKGLSPSSCMGTRSHYAGVLVDLLL